MMRKNLTTGLLALVMALGAVACSDDDPTEPKESELSTEEATALAEALARVGDDVALKVFLQAVSQGSNALAPAGIDALGDVFTPQSHGGPHKSVTLSVEDVPCVGGEGDVSAQLTVTTTEYPEEDRVVLEAEGTMTHQACRVVARKQQGQQVFAITGDPNLSWTLRLEAVGDELVGEQTFDYNGAFRWATPDGRGGRCTVDYSLTVDMDEKRAEAAGTFCGVNVQWTAGGRTPMGGAWADRTPGCTARPGVRDDRRNLCGPAGRERTATTRFCPSPGPARRICPASRRACSTQSNRFSVRAAPRLTRLDSRHACGTSLDRR